MRYILFNIAVLLIAMGCNSQHEGMPIDMSRWIVNNSEVVEKDFLLLSKGDSALFNGENKEFTNFEILGDFMLSEGAKAALLIHTDSLMASGYEIFFGNGGIDGLVKSGSLTGVRNLFKSLAQDEVWSTFAVKVSGKRITIEIKGDVVVDYIEPDSAYRVEKFSKRLLSSGNFAFKCIEGSVEFRGLRVATIDDPLLVDSSHTESEDTTIMALQQELFPLIDYHVHLKGLTKEQAYQQSLELGINYGIAPNCGKGFPITNEQQVREYRDSTIAVPFLFGMQGEGREWPTTFSKECREMFDYVFTDALTFDDHRGRRTKLWIDSLVYIDIPMSMYMDLLVERSIKVVESEPLDIFVNPTLLPVKIRSYYDKLWTTARMDALITALKESNVALEINDRYEIPSIKFIKRAKKAGIKFTFGTNNVSAEDLRGLKYSIRAAKEAELTKEDMWNPSMKKDR